MVLVDENNSIFNLQIIAALSFISLILDTQRVVLL